MIELIEVTRTYQEGDRRHTVLNRASLRVEAGEFVAMLGKSGSGKSTLLNLISGLDLPDSGEVRLAGRRMDQLGEQARTLYRRRHIGFVFQFFNLIPTLTVEENLLLPLELNGLGDRSRALSLLEEVGLGDRRSSYPDRLSGGEQQRVAVARALAHDPDLILADEPTGNLDAETGERVQELLTRLVRERGKTLLVATHSPEVVRLAGRVLRIHEGQLVDA